MNTTEKHFKDSIKYMVEKSASETGIPIIHMMEMAYVDCNYDKKTLTTKIQVKDWLLNPQGSMHGGLIATAFDTTLGILTHYYAEKNFITTVELSTKYLKSIPKDCHVLFKAKAMHTGRTLVSLIGEAVIEETGVVASTCSSTFMIVRGKEAQVKPLKKY